MEGSKTQVAPEPPETVHSIVPEGSVASPAAVPLSDEILEIDPEVAEKARGAEAELDKLRQDMGITQNVDPLTALLNSPVGPETGVWRCSRLKVDFKIRSLNNDAYAKAQEQATRFVRNRRTGRMEKDVDGAALSFLVVVSGTTNPDFNDQRVLSKYKALGPQDAVKKALLPGEIDALAEKILQLSGFDEDVEDQGKD
jgi:hypothetical protein